MKFSNVAEKIQENVEAQSSETTMGATVKITDCMQQHSTTNINNNNNRAKSVMKS